MYLVTASEIQEMDRQTIESFGMPGRVLMENAGRGATRILLDHFSGCIKRNVGVIAGRGNNGGDGFVIARYLAQKGITVSVYLLAESNAVKGDAAANLKLLSALEIPLIEMPDKMAFSKHKSKMRHFDLWVDAIFGTGLKSEVKGYFRDIVNYINSLNKPIWAVDSPSGLNPDTGQPCGACIRAQATATFAFAKTGHLLYPGAVNHHIFDEAGRMADTMGTAYLDGLPDGLHPKSLSRMYRDVEILLSDIPESFDMFFWGMAEFVSSDVETDDTFPLKIGR